MAAIDELLSTFMGQNQTALDAPPAPWQQELLESVNPQKVKRQNIARALAKASTAMATTPGNFLAGISAAAATGADAYLTGRDQAEDQRLKVQQAVQMQQQQDGDRRLKLLLDAIGVQQNVESHKAGMAKDKAYTDYYQRRGNGANGLSPAQIETNRRYVDNKVTRYEDSLRKAYVPEDQIRQMVEEERARLEEEFNLATPAQAAPGGTPGANVTQADLFAPQELTPQQYDPQPQQPSAAAPAMGGIRDGATATNPQTGERIIYRNGQWQPL